MEITTDSPEWDPVEDRQIWNQFLATRTGRRLVPKILESVPPLLAKGDVNEILIRSGDVRGWQGAISALLALSVAEPEPAKDTPSTQYPALDDDTKWGDGKRLETPNP